MQRFETGYAHAFNRRRKRSKVLAIGREQLQARWRAAARMLLARLVTREGFCEMRTIVPELNIRSTGHLSDLVRRRERQIERDPGFAARAEACHTRGYVSRARVDRP
jgi:hypothetical protein